MSDNEEFGPASVQYGDWHGTAALDNGDDEADSAYALAGISQDEWTVIALDLYGGGGSWGGRVLAVPRGAYPTYEALKAAEVAGPLHVTAFALPYGTDPVHLLERFKRWSIHAGLRAFEFDVVIDETRWPNE